MTQLDSKGFKLKEIKRDNKITQSTSEEKKETKWNKIDWSKPYSEAEKESKWDKKKLSNDYSSKEEKIKRYKSENVIDNMMTGESYKSDHEYDLENSKDDLVKVKVCLKQINWSDISKDWKIKVYIGRGYKSITLNTYQDCSKSNPLYKHEKWLKWVYTNKELNLNDQSIAKICNNINNKTIGNWRARFNIQTKEIANYIKDGYKFLHIQKEYKHPEYNPIGEKRIYRQEHIVKMEKHLNKVLTSEDLSRHPCLVENDGKFYIKNGSIVNHINHNRLDNRIENLWLYKNDIEHHNSNINECLSSLIKLNQISFSDGRYYLNHDYDYRNLDREKIDEVLEKTPINNYENLNKVKETIKNMDWS